MKVRSVKIKRAAKKALAKKPKAKKPSMPKSAKRVKVAYDPSDYTRWLSDYQKYPASTRMAAELYRNGITVREFERSYHRQDLLLSKHVLEVLINLEAGRLDEDRVPPFVPQAFRYETEASGKFKPPVAPLSDDDASRFLRRIKDACLEQGKWPEATFRAAVTRVATRPSDEVRVIKVVQKPKVIEDDDEVPVPKKQKGAAKPVPVEKASGEVCAYCKLPLHDIVVGVRHAEGNVDKSHLSCHTVNAPTNHLVDGQSVFDPATGGRLVWSASAKKWNSVPRSSEPFEDEEST